jgi:hypothetical protein
VGSLKSVTVLAAVLALELAATACGVTRVQSQGRPSPGASVSASAPSSPSPEVTASATTFVSSPVSSPLAAPEFACSTATPPDAEGVSLPTAAPGSLAAMVGDLSARLSWAHQGSTTGGDVAGASIAVTRAGVTLLNVPVTAPAPGGVARGEFANGWETLGEVCLEVPASGLPVVYLEGYAGAMTCCGMVRTYYPSPEGTYDTLDYSLGRGPGTFKLSGGQVILVATNPDFNTKFDCGACTPGALQILTFADGHTTDITRQFPDQIAAEADSWWKTIQAANPVPLGLVAPWTADECELGKQDSAYATLDALSAAGKLVNPSNSLGPSPIWPEGSAFIASLKSFLKTEGYCS